MGVCRGFDCVADYAMGDQMNDIDTMGELGQKIVDDVYEKYIDIVRPTYRAPNDILQELKKSHKIDEDTSAHGILKKTFYDSKSAVNGQIDSKIFRVDDTNVRIYVNYTDEWIQVDGDQKIADEMTILRGLKQEELHNKYLFYNLVMIMRKYHLL